MKTCKPAILLGFYILCASVAAAAAASDAMPRAWHFTALLDGKRIGTHDFRVMGQGADTDVVTEAHFRVKVAFLVLYQYDHQDHEVWHDGCLTRITSHTHDDGKSLAVQGERMADGFEVQTGRGAAMLPACVKTFAYWNQRFLTEPRLLNSQTGEFQPVTLTRDADQSVSVHGRMIPAQRYSLHAPKLDIDLWYSESGDWLALESKLSSGRTLRYEIQ